VASDPAEGETLEFLRAVFEKANDLITVVDPATTRYVEANETAERMLGYTRDELRALTVRDLHTPEDIRRIGEIRGRLDRDGHVRTTLSYVRKDGATFPVEASLTRITVGGRPLTLNIAHDITERVRDMELMRAQALELASAKGFLEALQERATDGLSLVDEKGVIVYVNTRQVELNGGAREDTIGRHFMEFVAPEAREVAGQRFARIMAGEEVRERYSIVRTDGSTTEMDISSILVTWGERTFVFSLTRDVTAEVRQQRELTDAKGLLEAVQEYAQDAMYLMDSSGRILFLNAHACKLMGRRREQVVGIHYNELSPEPLKKPRAEQFDRALRGETLRVRERMHRPDGAVLTVDIVSSRVQWGGRDYVFSVVRDVTEAVAIETTVSASRERMARQQAALVAVTHSDVFQTGDITDALEYMSEMAGQALDTARTGIFRYTHAKTAIRALDVYVRPAGTHESGVELESAKYPAYFRALEETEVIAASDAQSDPRTSEYRDGYLRPFGITSMMDAPIHLHGRLEGVLCFEHVGPCREWSPDEKTFAVAMAHLVSMALARWDQQRLQRRLAAQNAATRALAESDTLVEAAPLLIQAICIGLGWEAGLLWAVDAEAGVLRCAEAWARPGIHVGPFIVLSRSRTFAPGIGLPGRVWSSRRPAWIPDVTRDANFPRAPVAAECGLHGGLGFPVMLGNDVHAVIEFFSREIREPDDELLEMMSSVGSQVGQFIERTRAEDEVRFQKTLLETESDAAIEGILLVGGDGRILSSNRRFREIWGIPPEVLAKRSDDAALASVLSKLADPDGFLSRVRYLYDHPDEQSRDVIFLKDGRVLDRYSSPVRSGETHYGRVWYFRDVTDQKRAEDQLRRAAQETRKAYDQLKAAQAQLVQSEKLASVGMLVSGVAHEINNPINVIYGNLQLLKERYAAMKPPQMKVVRQMLADAIKAAVEARGVIEVFRSFARDARTAEPSDVNRCVRETLAVARPWLKKLRVETKLGKLPLVPCFPGQLNQVLLNLVKNAAEAMGGKGRLAIRTFRRGKFAVVDISDSGPGIPDELKAKIFDAFFSTKAEGMGLGLSISATIIEHHGGQLSLARTSKRGSTFRLELPVKS